MTCQQYSEIHLGLRLVQSRSAQAAFYVPYVSETVLKKVNDIAALDLKASTSSARSA